jgi:hypothetical protein
MCAGLCVVLLGSAASGQDRQRSASHQLVGDLGSLAVVPSVQLRYFGDPVPDVGTLTGMLTREFTVTRRAVEHYFSLRQSAGARTATVPVPFFKLELEVSSEYVSYDLFNAPTRAGELCFGPYIQNWRSARKAYDGHYGLRLHFPW